MSHVILGPPKNFAAKVASVAVSSGVLQVNLSGGKGLVAGGALFDSSFQLVVMGLKMVYHQTVVLHTNDIKV